MATKKSTNCILINTLNQDVTLSYKGDVTVIPPKGRITVKVEDIELGNLPAGLKHQLTEV